MKEVQNKFNYFASKAETKRKRKIVTKSETYQAD